MALTLTETNTQVAIENSILVVVNAVENRVSTLLGLLVLVVVRLIISGRVAVGGFARS